MPLHKMPFFPFFLLLREPSLIELQYTVTGHWSVYQTKTKIWSLVAPLWPENWSPRGIFQAQNVCFAYLKQSLPPAVWFMMQETLGWAVLSFRINKKKTNQNLRNTFPSVIIVWDLLNLFQTPNLCLCIVQVVSALRVSHNAREFRMAWLAVLSFRVHIIKKKKPECTRNFSSRNNWRLWAASFKNSWTCISHIASCLL